MCALRNTPTPRSRSVQQLPERRNSGRHLSTIDTSSTSWHYFAVQRSDPLGKENSVRINQVVFVASLTLGLLSCDADNKPTYDQLKQRNEELEGEVQDMHEKIRQAKSDLDDLKSQISALEDAPCHEDDASDLENKADDVDQALDDAENP